MALVTDLASAITRQENVNPSYNNPGGIFDVANNRIKTYGTYDEGYQALLNTVNAKIARGYNLYQFFNEYAPYGHGSNDPNQYAKNVSSWLGIDPNVPLNTISSSSIDITTGSLVTDTGTVTDSENGMPVFTADVTAMLSDQMPWILGALVGGLLYLLTSKK